MSPELSEGPAVYQLTVSGPLGLVLRCALRPHKARAQTCTILRARASADKDLVDLVMLLQSKGLKLDGVFSIDARRPA